MLTSEAGPSTRPMELEEYERYGRQMILPGWGLQGQLRLRNATIAVIGAGGLGCPVLQYLAGAGVGTIYVFDHDTVSVSNLHRQVLHTSDRVGTNKAVSASLAMKALNPFVKVIPHAEAIFPSTALDLLRLSQIIVDCTDRPMTRYIASDAAVRLGVPLVSGAAIKSSGQWAVYGGYTGALELSIGIENNVEMVEQEDRKGKKRACYRCIWPSVLPGASGRCEDMGVWGVVTGMVGTGMASEVIKLLLGTEDEHPILHLLHFGQAPLMRSIKLRAPSPKCIACGVNAVLSDNLDDVDYLAFCGDEEIDEASGIIEGGPGERLSATELSKLFGDEVQIVDVRSEMEVDICAIPGSINIPLDTLLKDPAILDRKSRTIVVCKQGNDSQRAANAIRRYLRDQSDPGMREMVVQDLRGGLRAWSRDVDPNFPTY